MSSMYKFVKGSRLFMQGTRESTDYDNVHDTFRPTFGSDASPNGRNRGGELRGGGGGDRYATDVGGGDPQEDDLRAVHTMRSMNVEGNTEWEKSSRTVRHGGIKTRSSRTVRKVTTVSRGEQSVTSESVMSYASDGSHKYPAIAHDKKSLKFRVVDEKVSYSEWPLVGLLKMSLVPQHFGGHQSMAQTGGGVYDFGGGGGGGKSRTLPEICFGL
jgi:hypothetical protein